MLALGFINIDVNGKLGDCIMCPFYHGMRYKYDNADVVERCVSLKHSGMYAAVQIDVKPKIAVAVIEKYLGAWTTPFIGFTYLTSCKDGMYYLNDVPIDNCVSMRYPIILQPDDLTYAVTPEDIECDLWNVREYVPSDYVVYMLPAHPSLISEMYDGVVGFDVPVAYSTKSEFKPYLPNKVTGDVDDYAGFIRSGNTLVSKNVLSLYKG